MRTLFVSLCLFVALVDGVLAQTVPSSTPSANSPAIATGSAQGTLIADGKSIPLRYSYVIDVDDVEDAGLLMSDPRKYTVIVLSDRLLPPDSVADRYAPFSDIHSPADQFSPPINKIVAAMHGVLLKIEPTKNAVFIAQILYPNAGPAFTVEGTEYPDRVSGLSRVDGTLTGTASVSSPVKTGSQSAADGPKKYQYRVSFRAPIQSEPPVTDQQNGAAAYNSPPALAVRAYWTAGKKGDLATLKKLTAGTHLAYLQKADYVKSLKQADLSLLPTQLRRVVVRGDTATVMIVSEKPNYSQVPMRLVRQSGLWKLYWP